MDDQDELESLRFDDLPTDRLGPPLQGPDDMRATKTNDNEEQDAQVHRVEGDVVPGQSTVATSSMSRASPQG